MLSYTNKKKWKSFSLFELLQMLYSISKVSGILHLQVSHLFESTIEKSQSHFCKEVIYELYDTVLHVVVSPMYWHKVMSYLFSHFDIAVGVSIFFIW